MKMNEPLIGYRAWFVKPDGLLQSFFQNYTWRTGKPQKTILIDDDMGFYAYKNIKLLIDNLDEEILYNKSIQNSIESLAIGSVYLWGETAIHETGFRSEFAYPKKVLTL